ncbi:MAG: 30S ribosomal protein S12 methylthiotransferase RimO [Bacteroidales bacterium]|nr:30S ribosomal protein S12 methylthiotransferase RimO [Bacteroidales bacterium]
MKINIITLGCSKNTVDSENLASGLSAQGHTVYFDSQRKDCDAIIVNTCGFIGDAKEESINTILQQIALKTRGRKARKLIACGCLVERYKEELTQEMPEVDAWYGVHEWDKIVQCLNADASDTQAIKQSSNQAISRPLSTPSHYAYLKIAEGCNRSCSYCAIPLIRGAHKSIPIDELVAEAKALVAKGVKELIVISQDTTFYGLDLYHRRALGELLDRLAEESGAEWIRLHYTYPASFPDDALDAIARHPNICKYIDIPLQHINTRILTSMQRGIDREGTLRLLARFREKLPTAAVRTTLIVGYPGETEADFEELKDFVRQARFDRMGCFAYSPEEGTPAEPLGDPVSDEEKQRRVSELMAIQEEISLEKNQERIGKVFRCLVDRIEDEYIVARTEYDSPEVDDEVLIPTQAIKQSSNQTIAPGDFISVCITDATEHDIYGEIIYI